VAAICHKSWGSMVALNFLRHPQYRRCFCIFSLFLQSPFISSPLMDSPRGLGSRAHSPAAEHFDAVYTVKQPYE